jgi:hypothetical protein
MAQDGDHSRGPPDSLEAARPWPPELQAAVGLLNSCLQDTLEIFYACKPKRTAAECIRKLTRLQEDVRSARPLFDEIGSELRRTVGTERVLFQGKRYANAFDAAMSFAEEVLDEARRAAGQEAGGPTDFDPSVVADRYAEVCRRLRNFLGWFDASELVETARTHVAVLAAARARYASPEVRFVRLEADIASLHSRQTSTEHDVVALRRTAKRLQRHCAAMDQNSEPGKIPSRYRTRPMTLRAAARLMGYGKSKDAAERLRNAISAESVRCERLTRQQYVFDKRDFPEEQWPQLTPTGPN